MLHTCIYFVQQYKINLEEREVVEKKILNPFACTENAIKKEEKNFKPFVCCVNNVSNASVFVRGPNLYQDNRVRDNLKEHPANSNCNT